MSDLETMPRSVERWPTERKQLWNRWLHEALALRSMPGLEKLHDLTVKFRNGGGLTINIELQDGAPGTPPSRRNDGSSDDVAAWVLAERLAIVVVTHNRPTQLRATIRDWTFSCPDYVRMRVIVNHPDGMNGITVPERCQVVHSGRPPEHQGNLAQSWNLGLLWAFRDPEVDWVALSQDDVVIEPGWLALANRVRADLYAAPAGDQVMLMNRRALREIGWFDERFTTIGFHEFDWFARAIRTLGPGWVMLEDAHGWSYNPVGLSSLWRSAHDGKHTERSPSSQERGAAFFREKWGMGYDEIIGPMARGDVPAPRLGEVDWYPWFQR